MRSCLRTHSINQGTTPAISQGGYKRRESRGQSVLYTPCAHPYLQPQSLKNTCPGQGARDKGLSDTAFPSIKPFITENCILQHTEQFLLETFWTALSQQQDTLFKAAQTTWTQPCFITNEGGTVINNPPRAIPQRSSVLRGTAVSHNTREQRAKCAATFLLFKR